MGKLHIFDWRWQLKSSPEELWEYVGDTNRLNIVTGMPKIFFREEPQPDGSIRRYAHAPIYSWLALDWEEVPFDWVKPLRHSVKRVFSTRLFPIKSLQNVFHFYPLPNGGTELLFELTLEENGLLGKLLIPGIAKTTRASFERAFHQMDGYIQNNQVGRAFETPLVPIEGTGKTRLDNLIDELRQTRVHDRALLEQFYAHLLHSPQEDLTRMRPFAFARHWGTDRVETLALFLHAASLGILDLSWDILCPECRGNKGKANNLADLPPTVHCPSCNIDYTLNFEQSVEATFNLNPQIAPVHRVDYCIGGPHATPHVLVQQMLAPGESRTTSFPIREGHYRLRAPRLGGEAVRAPAAILAPIAGQPWVTVVSENAPSEINITIQPNDMAISTSQVEAGEITMTMTNTTPISQMLIWEDGAWSDQLATAADVTALQAFRDLFSSEALRPGYTIGIKNMVILFSDLKDSTRLYQKLGDATAFGTVIDHFGILKDVIAEYRGGIVKTIGDAVMAVFRDAGDAFQAAVEMHRKIQLFNEANAAQPLTLKLGLHQGPCIAVNLNDRLDYFGSTVNLASRLEGKAQGGDLITSNAIIEAPSVRALLEQMPLRIERFTASLKGLEGDFKLYRVCPFDLEPRTEEMWVDAAD